MVDRLDTPEKTVSRVSAEFIAYRIIDRITGEAQGSYSRACHDEYDFDSPQQAREANCHGIFKDRETFRIAKYRVIYELLEEEVD